MSNKEVVNRKNYKQLLKRHLIIKQFKNISNDIELEFLSIGKSKAILEEVYKKVYILKDNIKIENLDESLKIDFKTDDILKLINNSKSLFYDFYTKKVILFYKDFKG